MKRNFEGQEIEYSHEGGRMDDREMPEGKGSRAIPEKDLTSDGRADPREIPWERRRKTIENGESKGDEKSKEA